MKTVNSQLITRNGTGQDSLTHTPSTSGHWSLAISSSSYGMICLTSDWRDEDPADVIISGSDNAYRLLESRTTLPGSKSVQTASCTIYLTLVGVVLFLTDITVLSSCLVNVSFRICIFLPSVWIISHWPGIIWLSSRVYDHSSSI